MKVCAHLACGNPVRARGVCSTHYAKLMGHKPSRRSPKPGRRQHRCPTGYHVVPSRSCYTGHKCRCPGCKTLNTAYCTPPGSAPRTPDREPVAALIRWLYERGAPSQRWIATHAGVSQATISHALTGYRPTVRAETAAAVHQLCRDIVAGRVRLPGERRSAA